MSKGDKLWRHSECGTVSTLPGNLDPNAWQMTCPYCDHKFGRWIYLGPA